jgi:uncharacterized protein YecT (DUF1311 family)
MKRIGLAVALLGSLALAPASAPTVASAAAAMSCNQPGSDFDRLYCENKVFMQADVDLNAAYGKLRARLSPADQQTLKVRQRAWIQQRNSQCSRSDGTAVLVNLGCADQMTIDRTNWLGDRLRECTSSGCRSARLAE